MIKWFDTKQQDKNCIITIYDTNITLNKHACDLVETAYTVMLGLDYDSKILYIKPLKKDIATRGDIPETSQYKITLRPSYGRVSNVEFIKEIKRVLKVDSLKVNPKKFAVDYVIGQDILKIDLTREV